MTAKYHHEKEYMWSVNNNMTSYCIKHRYTVYSVDILYQERYVQPINHVNSMQKSQHAIRFIFTQNILHKAHYQH